MTPPPAAAPTPCGATSRPGLRAVRRVLPVFAPGAAASHPVRVLPVLAHPCASPLHARSPAAQ